MTDPYEHYLREARGLFEAGNIVKAGQIWQAILKRQPGHAEALDGLRRVKARLEAEAARPQAAPVPEAQDSRPPRQTLPPPPAEINALLEAGCALYDAGLPARAIATWELALAKDPGNALARGYIEGARRSMGAEPAAAAPPGPPAGSPDLDAEELDKLLRDGCTLFDMGQTEDALRAWERILAVEPGHALARTYANGARRDLGLEALAPGALPAAPRPEPSAPPAAPGASREDGGSQADRLVREGVQIYDMGMLDEAVEKWRQALALEPGHQDAQGYLEMARRDRDQALSPTGAPASSAAAKPAPPPEDPRIAAAEGLLRNRRVEEAAAAFQRLLEAGSRDPRVLQGYQHARSLLNVQEEQAPIALQVRTPPPAAPAPPVPVGPPRAVTTRASVRAGLKPPRYLERLNLPRWLERPRNQAIAVAAFLGLSLLFLLLRSLQRDAALKAAVASAKAVAQAPGPGGSPSFTLDQKPTEIRGEGERALSDDPLTAYYRAQECLRLDPGDAGAAQLLDKARQGLAAQPPVGSGADADKAMKAGDLVMARDALGDLLRLDPDNGEVKAKARIVYLALVQSLAASEHYDQARALLLKGRAMFPQDRTWSARLRLLEEIRGLGKGDRQAWIPLLG